MNIQYDISSSINQYKRDTIAKRIKGVPDNIRVYQIVYFVESKKYTDGIKYTAHILAKSIEDAKKYIYQVHSVSNKLGRISYVESVSPRLSSNFTINAITDDILVDIYQLNRKWIEGMEQLKKDAIEKELIESKGRIRGYNSNIEKIKDSIQI